MKNFLQLKNTKPSRKVTLILAAVCLVGLFIGVSADEQGLLLDYLAAAALVLAFVHTWRKVKYFLILSGVSLIGFFLFAVLHNLFYGLGLMAADIAILKYLLDSLNVGSFLVALLVCPAGCLVGVVGSVLMYLKQRKSPV